MKLKEFRTGAHAAVQEVVGLRGGQVDPIAFDKAIAKAQRHMKAKYGSVDYQCEVDEGGYGNVVCFYDETVQQPDGKNTFNREAHRNFRSQGGRS